MCRTLNFISLLLLLIAVNSLFSSMLLFGQSKDVIFENYTVNNGLSHNNIYSIYQDKSGFLWFGTQDGLAKFDGYEFTTFRSNPNNKNSLATSNFGKIHQDSEGVFWFGTFGEGVDLYDPSTNTFKHLPHNKLDSNSLSNNLVTFVFQDSFNDIWIGTANGGLNRYNKSSKNFIRFLPKANDSSSISNVFAKSICQTKDGTIWVGTTDGLNKFNSKTQTFTRIYNDPNNKNSISGNRIQTMVVDDEDNIWMGIYRGGLNKFNPKTKLITRYKNNPKNPKSLNDDRVDYLFIDSQNQLWIGTYDGGLSQFDFETETFTHYQDKRFSDQGLFCNRIEYIYEDNSKNLWIATRGNGIWKLDLKPKKFNNLIRDPKMANSLPDASVTAITADKNGDLWIGTDGGGLTKYDIENKTFTHIQQHSSNAFLSGNRVWSVFVDNEGVIWAGTFNSGLNRIEYKNGKYIVNSYQHNPDKQNSLSSNQINIIKQDAEGTIWMGTSRGLSRLVKTTNPEDFYFKTYYYNSVDSSSFSDNYIIHMHIDSKNRMWVGSVNDGLFQFYPENSSFKQYQPNHIRNADSVDNYQVFHIYEDSKSNLWIGTELFGVLRFDPDSSIFIRPKNNSRLLGSPIVGIIEDNFENLWISTSNSLKKFNPVSGEIYNYGINDGLHGIGFNRNAVYKDDSGSLYFGSNSSLSYFNPQDLKHNEKKPRTVITSMQVLNKAILNAHLIPFEVLKNQNKPVLLNHKDYFFTIEFAALDFTQPDENQYKYMLENFDDDWIDAGDNRTATYTNLNPGTYVFKVKGSNNDKVWNEKPTELTIKVIPPFWKKKWFYALEIFLFIAIILIYVRFRTFVLIRDKKVLEEQVAIRTEKISQQNEELEVQRQHLKEINNTLEKQVLERTSDLEIAKNKAEESDRLKSAFLANMSHEIRTPMNAIIGFSELLNQPDIDTESKDSFPEHILENSYSLLHLFNDIIDISKIEAKQINLLSEACNLWDLLHEAYDRILEFRKSDAVDIKLNIDPSLKTFTISSDAHRISQIIDNLLSNAIKFTEKGSVEFGFEIESDDSEKFVTFFVHDTGIGLSKEQDALIFSRFTKVEDNKEKMYRGAGLGLPISKSLVELMGGTMWVESVLGKGSSFYFKLPVKV